MMKTETGWVCLAWFKNKGIKVKSGNNGKKRKQQTQQTQVKLCEGNSFIKVMIGMLSQFPVQKRVAHPKSCSVRVLCHQSGLPFKRCQHRFCTAQRLATIFRDSLATIDRV